MGRKQLKATASCDFLSEMPAHLNCGMYGEFPAGMDVQIAMKDLVTVLADTVRKAERGG
uniref:Uncharacterized protein n=1 Tax=Candidatus Methanophaga sp. ANME-1 ERB7 TaxID=2759913 RepID=A0A7G9Z744_9EURY|nr:hypothetical protein GIJIEOGM_00019 [Methanosarcinales archaeon ANME-1 ERB7]